MTGVIGNQTRIHRGSALILHQIADVAKGRSRMPSLLCSSSGPAANPQVLRARFGHLRKAPRC
jgi:hypothetical protein